MSIPASHPREEEAAAYVFGDMVAGDRAAFEQAIASDAALRSVVEELSHTAAGLSLAAPIATPPPEVRARVLANVATMPQEGAARSRPKQSTLHTFLTWAAAAAIVFMGFTLWNNDRRLRDDLAAAKASRMEAFAVAEKANALADQSMTLLKDLRKKLQDSEASAESLKYDVTSLQAKLKQREETELALKTELANLTKSREVDKMQIATLSATIAEYKQGVAVVVWDSKKQAGILKLEKMPPLDLTKDYQLWVVDPAQKQPVNAGVVHVDANGFAEVQFKPTIDVSKADKFALSVEKKGGVQQNEGPIVLLSP